MQRSFQILKKQQEELRNGLLLQTMTSPVGKLKLIADDKGLAAILWENDDPKRVKIVANTESKNHPTLLNAEGQLNEYFGDQRTAFSLNLNFVGTEFQKKVWSALLTIPLSERFASGWGRQWKESNFDCCSLPSGHWGFREFNWVCGWTQDESTSSESGGRTDMALEPKSACEKCQRELPSAQEVTNATA